ADRVRPVLATNPDLLTAFGRAWPLLEPTDLVADLWSVPAYLRMCAPHLDAAQVAALQRPADSPWTTADLPILDAARRRLGDPGTARRLRRQHAQARAERERLSAV